MGFCRTWPSGRIFSNGRVDHEASNRPQSEIKAFAESQHCARQFSVFSHASLHRITCRSRYRDIIPGTRPSTPTCVELRHARTFFCILHNSGCIDVWTARNCKIGLDCPSPKCLCVVARGDAVLDPWSQLQAIRFSCEFAWRLCRNRGCLVHSPRPSRQSKK